MTETDGPSGPSVFVYGMFRQMISDLPTRLRAHIERSGLFTRPGVALLAVSGGPDSVALLGLMAGLAGDLGLTLAVGHVDHGISPDSADVAESVMAQGVRHGIPGHLVTLNLGPDASETTARRERYRALRGIQSKIGAAYLVTAHHADDQVETVLYRVLRGSAPAGLAGILPLGPDGLVRPLLPFRRAEVRASLGSRPAFEDPANANVRHDRSWLRVELLPLLRERFGDVETRLLGLQRYAAQERSAWAGVLRSLPGLDFRAEGGATSVACAFVQTCDKLLSVALLRALAREAGVVVGPNRAARLAGFVAGGKSGSRMELGQGALAELAFGRLRIVKLAPGIYPAARWGDGDAGRAEWDGWEIAWRREAAGESTRRGFSAWVLVSSGEVRAPERGDRILPLGGVGHRPVRRVLMEAQVSRLDRAGYPVIVRDGRLLWLPGVCRSSVDVPVRGAEALRVDVRAR